MLKKKHIIFAILTGLMIIGLMHDNTIHAQQEEYYYYSYAVEHEDNSVILKLIDPITESVTDIAIPVPDDQRLYEAVVSPNGEYVVLLSTAYLTGTTTIFHIPTQTSNSFASGTGIYTEIPSELGRRRVLEWTPDSSRFAYLDFVDGQNDVYIYDVATQTSFNITNGNYFDIQTVKWDDNGQFLAFAAQVCDAECLWVVVLYDSTSKQITSVLNLPNEGGRAAGGICELELSPNVNYFVYVSACEGTNPFAYKEIYYGTVPIETVTQLTNFTEIGFSIPNAPPGAEQLKDREAIYDPIWLDDDTLLVGSLILASNAPRNAEGSVIQFDFSDGLSQQTILNRMGEQWTFATESNEIAYLSYSDTSTLENAKVEVATLTENGLTNIVSYPAGCNLAWSPDLKYLAYTQSTHSGCPHYLPITQIQLLNRNTDTLSNITVNSASTILPVGWVTLTEGGFDGYLNDAPTPNAGTDQTITTLNNTASVTLDGSGSSDADGSIVSYIWTDSTGAQVATGVSPTVDLPVGEHTLTLTVTDDDGATASDDVKITITAP